MSAISTKKRDIMASMNHRDRGMSRLWQATAALVGLALMSVLFLQATPAFAQDVEVLIYEVAYIDPQTSERVDQDCLRFSLADGRFRSDIFSSLGVPDGLWNAVRVAEGFAFSAFMNTIASDAGRQFPFTASYGGLIDETVSTIEGAVVLSNGARLALFGTFNDRCTLPRQAASQQRSLQGFGY